MIVFAFSILSRSLEAATQTGAKFSNRLSHTTARTADQCTAKLQLNIIDENHLNGKQLKLNGWTATFWVCVCVCVARIRIYISIRKPRALFFVFQYPHIQCMHHHVSTGCRKFAAQIFKSIPLTTHG